METANKQEIVRFWRDADLGNVEFLRATYITHVYSRHTHEGYAVGLIERGAETFEYRHSKFVAPAGHVVVINPGEVHTGQAATALGWSYNMLYPDVSLLQEATSQITGRTSDVPFFPDPVIQDDQLANAILGLHKALESGANALERQSRQLLVFGQLVARHADNRPNLITPTKEQTSVRLVREYLESLYARNILLEELASIANLSPYHLLRVFRQEIGLPPHSYLMQVRVRRAQEMLRARLPVSQVALETGFTDQSHLNRHFKRIVGVTPGQYLVAL